MWLSLISVGLGSLATLLQYFGLSHFMTGQNFHSARAAINTMNLMAPFFCLGLDNAAPRIVRSGSNGNYVWSLLIISAPVASVLMFISWLNVTASFTPLLVGAAFALTVSVALVASNFTRAHGAYRRFFIYVNFYDRFARTSIILLSAIVSMQFYYWALLVFPLFISYSIFVVFRSEASFAGFRYIPLGVFKESLPMMLSSVALIVITRSPYFAAYAIGEPAFTKTTDLVLLFSLFLIIPILNVQKIAEIGSVDEGYSLGVNSYRLMTAEFLLVSAYLASMFFCYLIGYIQTSDFRQIVLPIGIGMIVLSHIPNYAHALMLKGRSNAGFAATAVVILGSLFSYFSASIIQIPILSGFILSTLIYLGFGMTFWEVRSSEYISTRRVVRTLVLTLYVILAVDTIPRLTEKFSIEGVPTVMQHLWQSNA